MTLLGAAGLARGAAAPGTEARGVWLHLPNMFDADPVKGKEQVHSTVQKLAEHNFNLVLLWVTSDYLVALDDPEYQKKNRNASWDSLGVPQHGGRCATLVATKEHPVVSAYRHAADRALGWRYCR